MNNIVITNDNVNAESLFEESYNRLLPEYKALQADDLVQVNLEVVSAVATTFGVLPELNKHRDSIATYMPNHDLVQFGKLEDYAKGLSHANTLHYIATQPPDDLQLVYDEAVAVRERLLSDTNTLIARGYINAVTLKGMKGPVGYKNVATDLQILASNLKDNWATISGKCAIEMGELEHALKLAARILRVVGLREQSPAVIAAAADIRTRAFTQFVRAYDNARRAIIYLRWHEGDADIIAPSLYAGRSNGRKKAADANDKPTPAPAPTTAIPAPNAGTATPAQPSKASIGANGPFVD
jgi:hypothetical protein